MIYFDGYRQVHVHKSSYSTFENSRIALLYHFIPHFINHICIRYDDGPIDGPILYLNCEHKFG